MCCGAEAGSYLRLVDSCITQRPSSQVGLCYRLGGDDLSELSEIFQPPSAPTDKTDNDKTDNTIPLPGDAVEIKAGTPIYTWVSWASLPLAGGGVANQRVASETGAAITLRSPRLVTPSCSPVVLPERVALQAP